MSIPNEISATGTLEEKLKFLASLGLNLAEPFGIEELLSSWPRSHFESSGFFSVLYGLGMTEERPPWRPHSANMMTLDRECISGNGSYVRIAEKLKRIAQGSLSIENIRDHISLKEGVAWLEFNISGKKVHLDCRVKYDWVDPSVFGHFTELLEAEDPDKTFSYLRSKDQVAVLACTTHEGLLSLRAAEIPFERLTAKSLE